MYLSPSKLNDYLACPHLSKLELAADKGILKKPHKDDPLLELLQLQGDRHEKAYLEKLEEIHTDLIKIDSGDFERKAEQTLSAIRKGVDVIFQAAFRDENWKGYADFLLKSDKPSDLGAWSYSIHDTKLSKEVKGSAIIQLCIYSELLEKLQGCFPEKIVIVGGNNKEHEYDPNDFLAYVNYAKDKFIQSLAVDLHGIETIAAEPVEKCHTCNWRGHCESVWKKQDHLKLIAGSNKTIRKELQSIGINTLASFAKLEDPPELQKSSPDTTLRIHKQAKIQLKARNTGKNEYEYILPVTKDQGLSGLPVPSKGDIFFDIEGDMHIGELGLEYLLGWIVRDGDKEVYFQEWSKNNVEEKTAFYNFIKFILDQRVSYPDMHVYHFGHYEATVIRRLSTRYNVFVDEVDDLLRYEVFIDLHRVVKNGLRLSVTGYGLKQIEGHYDFQRDIEQLRQASMARKRIALLLGSEMELHEKHIRLVQDYNMEDCSSTLKLHNWLEEKRNELEGSGIEIQRFSGTHEEGEEERSADERIIRLSDLYDQLYDKLSDSDGIIREDLNEEERAIKAVADILLWYRREDKSHWWEFFHMMEMSVEEMKDNRKTLAGPIRPLGISGTVNNSNIYRWSYPPQQFEGFKNNLHVCPGKKSFKVHDFNTEEYYFEFKRTAGHYDELAELIQNSVGLVASDFIASKSQMDRLIELGDDLNNGEWKFPCAKNLLLRKQLLNNVKILEGESSALESAIRLAHELKPGTVLPIQGPPGTGKTYTAAHMICELMKDGKKVGVTAQSHSVIRNLLETLQEIKTKKYAELNFKICKQKKSSSDEIDCDWLILSQSKSITESAQRHEVLGGTSWLWSNEKMKDSVDVLFIDEAGQFSLADAIACSHAASSMVLLGDPQQLENVTTGVHPQEIKVSVLGYWLNNKNVIGENEGLFLNRTFRMAPKIQDFISKTFYNGKLESSEGLANQTIISDSHLNGSGIYYYPCFHEGNQSSSEEEVIVIKQLVDELLKDGQWVNKENKSSKLTAKDILIVAPYNAQVNLLKKVLPNVSIGTVDKFQGKEAPLVIYSMATSSKEEAPRGMEFLYSLNRLNVAMSRAQGLALLVASPTLFEISCNTPDQMRLANGFIRFLNMAKSLHSDQVPEDNLLQQ